MHKQEFLSALEATLTGIPQGDIEERIGFYREMIEDRVEEGLTEEQAIAELGTLEEVTWQIIAELSSARPVQESAGPSRAPGILKIVLLALGSPIWLSLLIALFAVVVSIYAVIWSVIVSLWAIELSIAVCSAGGAFAAIVAAMQGKLAPAAFLSGAGIACAGLAIFGFFGCRYASNAILKHTKKIFLWTKSHFMKKEAAK